MKVVRHVESTKNRELVIFLQNLKKILMKFMFCMQINMKISNNLGDILFGQTYNLCCKSL